MPSLNAPIWYGQAIVFSKDVDGTTRGEWQADYDQRIAGERIVRFMRGNECLKAITMDRYLELTGESKKK